MKDETGFEYQDNVNQQVVDTDHDNGFVPEIFQQVKIVIVDADAGFPEQP